MSCDQTEEKEIEDRVTCTTGQVDITLSNKNENTEQYNNVSTPWTYSFTIKLNPDEYQFVYVSAQNQQSSGTVVSEIRVDGSSFKKSTSTGGYVIATSSGSVEY